MSGADELARRDAERTALLKQLAQEAAIIRQLNDRREQAYTRRLDLYRQLVELGTVHTAIARAAGVSETAVSLALKPKQ